MKSILFIAAGGAGGAVARYFLTVLGLWVGKFGIPAGTLLSNSLGCFLFGICFGLPFFRDVGPHYKLLLFTGFLGSLTTFSTYSFESATFLETGQTSRFILHFLLHNGLGLGFFFLGKWFSGN